MAMDEVDFPSGSHDVRNVSKHSRDCRQGVQPTSLHQQYRYLPPNLLPRPPACHSNGIFTDMPASNEFSPDSVTEGVAINMDDSACVSSQFCGSEIRSPNVSGDETSEYSGGRYTVAERGRNENENERGWGEAKAEHDESMAELILTALQRKDDLLREQANTLKQRDLELAHLQGEVAGLREEKRLLLQQLRDCNETDTASKQTASASREQQADITSLNAQNKKLITQLSEARREAEEREEKYTADLQYIHEEMQEFSTLVDEVRSLRAALQQMESNLAGERELRKKCELQYRESTREAEEVLIREREENQKKLKRYKKLYEEAEAAGREATNEAKLLQEELQQLTVNHATLTVTFEVNEQRIADMSEEQAHLRASLQAAREETVILRASLERLRNKEYLEAEDEENCEDETELTFHAHFHTEAERSMYGTRKQLESMVATLERRLSDSEGREQMLSAERERLRTQLQQLAVSARKELLEQQQIADERAAVQRVHIQQLQRELDEKQQQQEEAEERAQAALLRAQEQFREACSELQQVKEERATAAGEESRRHVLFEKQIAKVLQALQNKLSRRNVECRMLKQQIKVNEEQNRKRLETNVSEPVRQDRRPPVQNVKDGSRVTRPARLPLHNTVVKQEVLLAAAQPTALQEQRADAHNARFTAPQSPACEYNCIEARLNEALARTTELEEQLQAKRRKYCAMVKDRKMLMERVEKQQQKQQWQIATLEDMQRETLRNLESTHRRRMSSAFAAAAEGNKRQQWVIQRGVARVVAELVEFIHELESYATVVGDRYVTRAASQNTKEKNHRVRLTYDSPPQDALSERENILRAACDDITRNFLGVNGGWEALCQSNSFTCSDISASFSFGKAIPQAMRQRVRCRIADYLKSQLLGTNSTRTGTGVTTTPGEMHKRSIGGGGNNKRTMNLSFGLHGEVEEERWLHGEPYAGAHGRSNRNLGTVPGSSSGESLIDVLMECVRYIFQA
ncbi:hypothetical protein DPX39_060013300 [Trypanosoma brucei equiperdum]|uniref:Uncharacterized protein n=1 Tax=Trypanosoma brucei equiperdum TaxID=630700 RepID=A0A3L6L5H5_9TRYP|nr:hypothetical protein DPX39_060013300 [Trypanosoma brucei equiperdum]